MASYKVVIGSLFALLVIAIGVLGICFYQDSQDRVIAAGEVSKAHETIVKTEEVHAAFMHLQLQAARLTDVNDITAPADCRAATETLYARTEELRELAAHRELQGGVDSLDALIRQFTRVSDSISQYVSHSGEVGEFKTERDAIQAKDIEVRIRDLKGAESAVLAQRKLALQERVAAFTKAFGMLTIAIGILLTATFLTVRYTFNKRKAAEDQIKEALQAEVELNTLKSGFVTLASHEFRTPLTAILSSAFLLEKYSFDVHQDKAVKHLARIKSSVSNLTGILDEFLSVTKIEEGQVQPNIEAVDLPGFLEDVCNDLQTFAKPGQTIHYSHTGAQEVKTDPVLLGNIVRNIVTNSIKYSPEGSPIFVSSSVNSKVHLAVRDHGIGIPASDQKHIFERFYRASNAGAVQGTGLGMHIMKHYVKMLNGSVKLESEVGRGTQVKLTFDQTS